MVVSINGGTPWFISWEIHLEMDDLGVPPIYGTSMWIR